MADAATRLGADQQMRSIAPRGGEEIIEVGLAIGHSHHDHVRGQCGLGGVQGVDPSLGSLALVGNLFRNSRCPNSSGTLAQTC